MCEEVEHARAHAALQLPTAGVDDIERIAGAWVRALPGHGRALRCTPCAVADVFERRAQLVAALGMARTRIRGRSRLRAPCARLLLRQCRSTTRPSAAPRRSLGAVGLRRGPARSERGKLAGDLLHYSYRDPDDPLRRIEKYTRIMAEGLHERGVRIRSCVSCAVTCSSSASWTAGAAS